MQGPLLRESLPLIAREAASAYESKAAGVSAGGFFGARERGEGALPVARRVTRVPTSLLAYEKNRCSMRPVGIWAPAQISSPIAAWRSSMPSPGTMVSPRASASWMSFVLRGS